MVTTCRNIPGVVTHSNHTRLCVCVCVVAEPPDLLAPPIFLRGSSEQSLPSATVFIPLLRTSISTSPEPPSIPPIPLRCCPVTRVRPAVAAAAPPPPSLTYPSLDPLPDWHTGRSLIRSRHPIPDFVFQGRNYGKGLCAAERRCLIRPYRAPGGGASPVGQSMEAFKLDPSVEAGLGRAAEKTFPVLSRRLLQFQTH